MSVAKLKVAQGAAIESQLQVGVPPPGVEVAQRLLCVGSQKQMPKRQPTNFPDA